MTARRLAHALPDRSDSPEDRLAAIAGWRQQLRQGRESLHQQYASIGGRAQPALVLQPLCRIVDHVVRDIWRALRLPAGTCLVAVGGYGRGELCPWSDVDLLVLLPDDTDLANAPALQQKLETWVGLLWDSGIEAGHSLRTVAHCLEESVKDVTVQTSLLESRWLAGSRQLFKRFIQARDQQIDPRSFASAKMLEQQQRHARYQDSPYSLEPNVKESPGGLRDLQGILWIARAAGLGLCWRDLAQRKLITVQEARDLAKHQRVLQDLRIRLHYLAGRREDRLLFDYQGGLAEGAELRATAQKRASELLMQRFYRSAKVVTQLNTILLQNMQVALNPDNPGADELIDERFGVTGSLLHARSEDLFEREPAAIFDSFLILQQRADIKGMTAPTLRALWRARNTIDRRFRADPQRRAQFLSFLQQPRGIVHGLRRMNQYSILGRYIPAFRRIVGQMQHDLFHVYTVDQHILQVVRNLRRFTMMEFAHEYPLCSRLMAGFERHWLLYVAALFHDIAKGRGGDHSQLGKADARSFCRAHGIGREDSALVVFLVEQHLSMSATAQKQDLSDPEVIRRFADSVKTERRLVALYLLTVADIRGTSPKVWNAWRGKLLEDLFRNTRRLLRGGDLQQDQEFEAKRQEALRLLRLYGLSDDAPESFWQQLDVPYFLRHDPEDIAWQTRNLHYRVNAPEAIVKARLSPAGEGIQVMIYMPDQRDLFARICGYFGSINLNIVDARIHTTRHGYALDTFQVMEQGDGQHYREMLAMIEHDLTERLQKRGNLPNPSRGRASRQSRHFPISPEVQIVPDEKAQYYLVSIIAADRPGLLYAIATLFGRYSLSLHTAKIVTLGERAEDAFLVSGEGLSNSRVVLLLEQDLLELLQG